MTLILLLQKDKIVLARHRSQIEFVDGEDILEDQRKNILVSPIGNVVVCVRRHHLLQLLLLFESNDLAVAYAVCAFLAVVAADTGFVGFAFLEAVFLFEVIALVAIVLFDACAIVLG